MNDYIHIVCIDAPSPPDYGGAIDMYYKIVSLHALGKKIILHYFDYKENRNINNLEKFCYKIYSYKRKRGFKSISFNIPYIVKSRIDDKLIAKLNEDNFPVLLEGIHCSGILSFLKNKERAIIRLHNNEAEYYKNLAATESGFFKRRYYLIESYLLKRYQESFSSNTVFACISDYDREIFKTEYHYNNVSFVPCFIPWSSVQSKEGKGTYSLYHGNMSISENAAAAKWLIAHVFSKTKLPVIIAGKAINTSLYKAAAKHKNISLVSDPDNTTLDKLIQNAHVNILPSFNNTGVKLKLLNALFNGRFCITNFKGLLGASINVDVPIAIVNEPHEYLEKLEEMFQLNFAMADIDARKKLLNTYNNKINAIKLTGL